MPLLQKLKSILGLGGADADPGERRDVGVTVEREAGEPAAATAESAGTTAAAPEDTGEESRSEERASSDASAEPAEDSADEAAAETEDAADDAEADETATGGADADEAATEEPEGAADDGGDLEEISGVGPAYAQRLRDAGVSSVADLAEADAEAIAAETDLSSTRIEDWIEQARER